MVLYDHTYDTRPDSLVSSNLIHTKLLSRILRLIIAFPLSLLIWSLLRILSIRYQVSIYVLKTFRPSFASTYINMMEPLCRQLQHDNNPRHIKILVEPGESVSNVLVKSYEAHFTVYLDDRRKFARLIAYLVPKSGLEKKYLNTSNKFLQTWLYPPSKNYASIENKTPFDLKQLGLDKQNFVIFAHSSRNYHESSATPDNFSQIQYRFNDLANHQAALKKIFENKLKVVRVGIQVDEMPTSLKTLPIIDYTGEIRNEKGEFWLYENCRFLLSDSCGAYWFARRFDRPTLLTNSYLLPMGYFSTLYTPMIMRSTATGKLLSFAEMLTLRHAPNFLSIKFMEHQHLEILPNSSFTLANGVDDMLNFASEKYDPSLDDLELMNRYNALLAQFNIPIVDKMTVPAISFLREYRTLL